MTDKLHQLHLTDKELAVLQSFILSYQQRAARFENPGLGVPEYLKQYKKIVKKMDEVLK